MFDRNWPTRILQCLALFSFIAAPLAAIDVVYLLNGDIIIGTLVGPETGGIAYKSFGEDTTIPLDSIGSTDKNLERLSTITVQVVLKDGSAIQGKIADYDEDIGLFLDISFGTLTIPGVAVAKIIDVEKLAKYAGATMQITCSGGVYWPLGSSADYFGFSWYAGAGADWAMPFLRGLYGGVRLTLYGIKYVPDDIIKYTMASIRPELTFKYLGWRMKDSFLGKMVPYATFGAGPVYIAVTDPASYPSRFGMISAEIALGGGLEFTLAKGLVMKMEGNASMIVQSTTPFLNAGAMLSICYER